MRKKLIHNPHAGEILKTEFLDPLKLSQNALAKAIGVPSNRIHAIIKGSRGITADTDLRLCRFFQLSDGYWLRLQNLYELMESKREFEPKLNKIQPYVYPKDYSTIL